MGADRWVAIAVTNDEEWQSLCAVIQRPDLLPDPRFADADGRREHQDELDAAITQWTILFDDHEATRRLQEAGVPSGPSLDMCRVFNEPQLREVGYISQIRTRDGELRELPGLPWRFEGGEEPIFTEAPVLGQDNEYVYQELLGLSGREVARLVEEEVIY